MASSPTVLAGTSTSASPTSASIVTDPKFPMAPMLLAVVAGAAIASLCVGCVVYYLAASGRLPVQGKAAPKAEAVTPTTTQAIPLEPIVVNLADPSGSSYLRITLTLRVANAEGKKNDKSKAEKGTEDVISAVRDTVITVLGQQTADSLLAADGKDRLKAKLKTALAEHNADLKVTNVFFTDFLVQR